MSIYSDAELLEKIYKKELTIDPFQNANIQPSSIDLTLGEIIEVPKSGISMLPLYKKEEIRECFESTKITDDGFILKPGGFVLGQIEETIALSKRMVGHIHNRNSLIRLGINVGLSSYINPGYSGKLPIAIHNVGTFEFKLIPGIRICQLVLHETNNVTKGYGERTEAKYHDEKEITLSRLPDDRELKEFMGKYGLKNGDKGLAAFLAKRIQEKNVAFIEQLTDDQKKVLGLA